MRQRLIWVAILLGASFYVVAFFIGDETQAGQRLHLTQMRTGLSRSINVVATMAVGLGIVNLFWIHAGNIFRRRKEWPFSIVVFAAFFAVVACLLWQYRVDDPTRQIEAQTAPAVAAYRTALALEDPAQRAAALQALPAEQRALAERYYEYQADYRFEPRKFYLDYVLGPLQATAMSLLGFYITYAAYRAFRIRSLEATVMMLSAALVILGSDPIGGWLGAQINGVLGGRPLVDLPEWADLDNRVLNSGMQRGLEIGIGVAVIAMGLRVLLGLERGLTQTAGGE